MTTMTDDELKALFVAWRSGHQSGHGGPLRFGTYVVCLAIGARHPRLSRREVTK